MTAAGLCHSSGRVGSPNIRDTTLDTGWDLNVNSWLCIVLLALLASAFSLMALKLLRGNHGKRLWISGIAMANFAVLLPLSGVVHIAQIPGVGRGYYDLMKDPSGDSALAATIISIICGGALLSGWLLADRRPKRRRQIEIGAVGARANSPLSTYLLIGFAILLLPMTIAAHNKMEAYATSNSIDRVITVPKGDATYFYLASWLPWTLTFIAVAILATRFGRSPVFVALVTAVTVGLISYSLSWTGGRTLALLMALPLIAITVPRLGKLRIPMLVGGSLALAAFLWQVTQARVGGRQESASVWSWIDWQWGRFSMVGFGHDFVAAHGHLGGQTLAFDVMNPLGAIAAFVHIPFPSVAGMSSLNIVSGSLVGDYGTTRVVPGLTTEAYMNFGYLGVIVMAFILGYLVRWVDDKYLSVHDTVGQLFWAYIGGVLILRTLPLDLQSAVGSVLFTGLPIAAVYFLTRRPLRLSRPIRSSRSTVGVESGLANLVRGSRV